MRRRLTFILSPTIFLIAIGFVLVPVQSAYAQRSKTIVEAVEVVGNRRLTAKEILSNLDTRSGEPFSYEQSQRDLRKLLALGVFDATQTRVLIDPGVRGGVVVTFEVVELPLLLEVKFQDLRGITESEVIEALRERNIHLVKDAVYEVGKVRIARGVIQQLLTSRGWPYAVVTVREEVGSTYASIEFTIRYEQ
jgi:outer membrane protein assembly factor BamA